MITIFILSPITYLVTVIKALHFITFNEEKAKVKNFVIFAPPRASKRRK